MIRLLSALWRVITNPPIEAVDHVGTVVDRWQTDRAEQWAISRPSWTYRFMTRQAVCGCTRRWWGTWTLYVSDCPRHMADLRARRDRP